MSGTARWLNSREVPNSPSIRRIKKAGAGIKAGRRITWPMAFAKSRFLIAWEAQKLTGPSIFSFSITNFRGPKKILKMNPGEPLTAIAHRSTYAKTEGGHHFCHGPPVFAENDAETCGYNPHAFFSGAKGLRFPVPADAGQKITAAGLTF